MKKIFLSATLFLILYVTAAFSEEVNQRAILTPSRLDTSLTKTTRSITILDNDDFGNSAYTSLPDIIGNVGGVDIRRRGPDNIQADINIRGTNFEENTVLVDGIKVNDPQTGHFDMDLPLTIMDVNRIEILKGPASSVYGPNSFGGVINIITKKPDTPEVVIDSSGGSYDYFRNALSVSSPAGPLNNRFSIEDSHSSGYMPETWFDTLTLSDSAVLKTDMGRYDFLFGYLKKDFAAAGYVQEAISALTAICNVVLPLFPVTSALVPIVDAILAIMPELAAAVGLTSAPLAVTPHAVYTLPMARALLAVPH